MNSFFTPADILLPKTDPQTFAVIACDQFSSDPAYWERVEKKVGDRPSALRLIVPEAYLGSVSMEEESLSRNANMDAYLKGDVFRFVKDSFIYVERRVTSGVCRRGVVGKLDLEAYDYLPGTNPPARASEKTVVDRLPPRIKVRGGASLEIPHILVLIDDEKRSAVEPLTAKKDSFEKVYDFELMEGGGSISGWRVTGEDADKVVSAIDALGKRDVQFVIGDGNHSLAAAKDCWREIKKGLTEEEAARHPARFALVELCNVYDEGILFEPIHRIVFQCDAQKLLADLRRSVFAPDGKDILVIADGKEETLRVRNGSLGSLIGAVQEVLDDWEGKGACRVDYIHDEDALRKLSETRGSLAIFFPKMDKHDFFATVEKDGIFPKKSFSIGHARDKRYYLECRKIK